ncbi:hypothetical protein [Methylobacterium fujisawaense]
MKRSTQLKLAEVEESYRHAKPAAHRCGLVTCQETGDCGFPTRCVALVSDPSSDDRVSEADIAAGASAQCRNCGSQSSLAEMGKDGYRSCCPERDMRLVDRSPGWLGRRVVGLDEHIWRQEGESNGWEAPKRRPWWKRLPVIRHVAALWLSWQVHSYAGGWASVGIGIGGPHAQDLWVVEGAFHGYW